MRAERGQYADALLKGHPVMLLGMESSGAMFLPLALHLRLLGRLSKTPGTEDSTVYGTARASPKAFHPHHSAAISAAVTTADANALLNTAAFLSFELTRSPLDILACSP